MHAVEDLYVYKDISYEEAKVISEVKLVELTTNSMFVTREWDMIPNARFMQCIQLALHYFLSIGI